MSSIRVEPSEFSRESFVVDIATGFLGNFLFFMESVMNSENVCSCCQQELDVKQASEISKAASIGQVNCV